MIYPYCEKGGSCKGIVFLLVTKYDVNVAIKIVE